MFFYSSFLSFGCYSPNSLYLLAPDAPLTTTTPTLPHVELAPASAELYHFVILQGDPVNLRFSSFLVKFPCPSIEIHLLASRRSDP